MTFLCWGTPVNNLKHNDFLKVLKIFDEKNIFHYSTFSVNIS
jgi:hypothetical protein